MKISLLVCYSCSCWQKLTRIQHFFFSWVGRIRLYARALFTSKDLFFQVYQMHKYDMWRESRYVCLETAGRLVKWRLSPHHVPHCVPLRSVSAALQVSRKHKTRRYLAIFTHKYSIMFRYVDWLSPMFGLDTWRVCVSVCMCVCVCVWPRLGDSAVTMAMCSR